MRMWSLGLGLRCDATQLVGNTSGDTFMLAQLALRECVLHTYTSHDFT